MSLPARTGSSRPSAARPAARAARTTTARAGAAARTGSSVRAIPREHRTGPVAAQPSRPHLSLVHGRGTLLTGPVALGRAAGERRAPFVLLLVGMILATALGLLFLNTAIAVDSLEASQLREANARTQQQVEDLEQQVTAGSTAAELAAVATAMGMVPAGTAAHLVLDPDGRTALIGTALPAEAPAPVEPPVPVEPAAVEPPVPTPPAEAGTPTTDTAPDTDTAPADAPAGD